MAIQICDRRRFRRQKKFNYLKANYGLIPDPPDVTGRILILDRLDYQIASIRMFCYGEYSRDTGLKMGYLNVCFTVKGVVPKIETVAKLFDEPK